MDSSEFRLLENALDGLDRLFDRNIEVYDLWALLYATNLALNVNKLSNLSDTIDNLDLLVKSDAPEDEQRDYALSITDDLRCKLSDLIEA